MGIAVTGKKVAMKIALIVSIAISIVVTALITACPVAVPILAPIALSPFVPVALEISSKLVACPLSFVNQPFNTIPLVVVLIAIVISPIILPTLGVCR